MVRGCNETVYAVCNHWSYQSGMIAKCPSLAFGFSSFGSDLGNALVMGHFQI